MLKELRSNINFVLLWLAQTVSGMGDILYTAGIMVNVYEYSGSALQTAWVMVAGSFPAFLIGPFAGAVVDRYDRKHVLIAIDIIRLVLVLMLLLFVSEDYFNMVGLYTIVAALSATSAFYRPAKMAIIPSVVKDKNIGQANSIFIGTNQAIFALGFGIGGVLTLVMGFEAFILINALSFLLSAIITYFIQTPFAPKALDKDQDSLFKSAIQGFSDLKNHKIALPLVLMEILEHFPHGVWTTAVLLPFVEKALGGTAEDWGYIASTYFGGMLVGAILATIFNKYILKYTGYIIIINAFLTALLTYWFAVSPTVLIALIPSILMGLPNSVRDVAQNTLLQTTVPQDFLGRVYAISSMFSTLMFMLAGLSLAWMADFTDPRHIYIGAAAMYLLTSLFAMGSKALRESRIELETLER